MTKCWRSPRSVCDDRPRRNVPEADSTHGRAAAAVAAAAEAAARPRSRPPGPCRTCSKDVILSTDAARVIARYLFVYTFSSYRGIKLAFTFAKLLCVA